MKVMQQGEITKMKYGISSRKFVSKVFIYGSLLVGSVAILLPLIWMISTSLKNLSDVFKFPPEFIPDPVVWSNYRHALTVLPFDTYLKNTMIIVTLAVAGEVLMSAVVAYAFSRLKWKGRDVLFVIVIATMMLPGQVTLIPVFIMFRNIGWLDTFLPMIVPSWFGNAFYIFLLRQYFMTISKDMDEAAVIDGCSKFGVFWRIILPMAKPALGAVAIFSFQFHWNDFFRPLIFIFSKEKYTLALGLRFFQGSYSTEWNSLMAASLVVMLPVIIIFFFAQRYFIQGVVLSGYK